MNPLVLGLDRPINNQQNENRGKKSPPRFFLSIIYAIFLVYSSCELLRPGELTLTTHFSNAHKNMSIVSRFARNS